MHTIEGLGVVSGELLSSFLSIISSGQEVGPGDRDLLVPLFSFLTWSQPGVKMGCCCMATLSCYQVVGLSH